MNFNTGVKGRIGISGSFECKDKDGRVLKTIEVKGSVPLDQLGLTPEEAQELITQQEKRHVADDRQ